MNGQEARLAHGMHVFMENRNGLVMDVAVSEANGRSERQEALVMLRRSRKRHRLRPRTLAADLVVCAAYNLLRLARLSSREKCA